MNSQKIDFIIQYALAVAGQNDDYQDRQLGPIHLIKYVYLADLAYAEQHEGQSFTEASWRFHKFGPWSLDVFGRIETALEEAGATKTKVSHPKYEDDFVRWSLEDEELVRRLAAQLPISVSLAIQNAVRSFGSDTASLLNHVYLTEPLLRAAPGENLELSPGRGCQPLHPETLDEEGKVPLSRKAKEERKRKLQDLKALVRGRLEERKRDPEFVPPDPPPRYDDVFQEGLACLEAEAGEPVELREYRAVFSDDVWISTHFPRPGTTLRIPTIHD